MHLWRGCTARLSNRYYYNFRQPEKIQDLIIDQIDGFNVFTKTRAAKIIRQMIDQVAEIPDTEQLQIKMCLTLIEWCSREKKTYLKHKI
jgi:26S proteasome regulatory subunit N6